MITCLSFSFCPLSSIVYAFSGFFKLIFFAVVASMASLKIFFDRCSRGVLASRNASLTGFTPI